MDSAQEKKERKARGKRSPGYPMMSLEEAIQRANILWDKDKNNPIPLKAVYEHLGYKTEGGYGGRVLAAMKHFGLIYEKQGDINLTDEAVDLAIHEASDEKYIETIKKLALKPAIYERIFNDYNGNLPSDSTLKIKLIKDYEFNPDKVNSFLSDFRRTIEYARVDESNIVGEKITHKETGMVSRDENKSREKFTPPPPLPPDDKTQMLEMQFLLSPTKRGNINIPYPLTADEWTELETILDDLKKRKRAFGVLVDTPKSDIPPKEGSEN